MARAFTLDPSCHAVVFWMPARIEAQRNGTEAVASGVNKRFCKLASVKTPPKEHSPPFKRNLICRIGCGVGDPTRRPSCTLMNGA